MSERGTSVEIHHYVFDGAFHGTEGSDPRELSFRRIAPTTIEQQTRRNGQITVTRRIQLSNDGRTMTFVASGTAGNGVKYENDIAPAARLSPSSARGTAGTHVG